MSGNRDPKPKVGFKTRVVPLGDHWAVETLYPWAEHLGWQYAITCFSLEAVAEARKYYHEGG